MIYPLSTILIVDDDLLNRKLLEALLRPQRYHLVFAINGEEALELISKKAPDLILLDVMMPGKDGYEIAEIIKADTATAKIPIIMVTAQGDRSTRLVGLVAGADDFLTKPVDRTELWLKIRNLLRLKAYDACLENPALLLEQQVRARTVDLQRFRTAMDMSVDAIFLVSRSTLRFIDFNATACSMLGYTRAELFQLLASDISSATRVQLESLYDAVIFGLSTNALQEFQLLHKDGSSLEVEIHRQALASGADWMIVSVVRNITKRKEAQEEMQLLNLQLTERVKELSAQLLNVPAI